LTYTLLVLLLLFGCYYWRGRSCQTWKLGGYNCGCMLKRMVLRAAGLLVVGGCWLAVLRVESLFVPGVCGALKARQAGDIAWNCYISGDRRCRVIEGAYRSAAACLSELKLVFLCSFTVSTQDAGECSLEKLRAKRKQGKLMWFWKMEPEGLHCQDRPPTAWKEDSVQPSR
jgi:hypothetical protein